MHTYCTYIHTCVHTYSTVHAYIQTVRTYIQYMRTYLACFHAYAYQQIKYIHTYIHTYIIYTKHAINGLLHTCAGVQVDGRGVLGGPVDHRCRRGQQAGLEVLVGPPQRAAHAAHPAIHVRSGHPGIAANQTTLIIVTPPNIFFFKNKK